MIKLVIKGAYYYDRNADIILVPHFTGEFFAVDCDKFVTMKELKNIYDDNYIDQVKDNPIEFEDNFYYDAEYKTFNVGDWELLSNLSELFHNEINYDW